MTNIFSYLSSNSYPGRGIIVGQYHNKPVIAYFIMGRSTNSRNRIFEWTDGCLRTKAYDESLVQDPSLIIYNALRELDGQIIVTNGNQTDTIFSFLENGQSFCQALDTREYEPDTPNFTPRISALIHPDGSYEMAILKHEGDGCRRIYYDYHPENNIGHFLSTYDHDGDPLPSFSSDPLAITIDEPLAVFAGKLWNSLNEDNRISLYVRFGSEALIFNRNMEKQS